MRTLNRDNINKKKIRGHKRKTASMIKNIEEATQFFPQDNNDISHGFWHMHLPVSQHFIDSSHTPVKIRRACIQKLIERTAYLISIKPKLATESRVVACISLPELWNSQIIIFYCNDYYSCFFDRRDRYQQWAPFDLNRSLVREWNLPKTELQEKGYVEPGSWN